MNFVAIWTGYGFRNMPGRRLGARGCLSLQTGILSYPCNFATFYTQFLGWQYCVEVQLHSAHLSAKASYCNKVWEFQELYKLAHVVSIGRTLPNLDNTNKELSNQIWVASLFFLSDECVCTFVCFYYRLYYKEHAKPTYAETNSVQILGFNPSHNVTSRAPCVITYVNHRTWATRETHTINRN